MKRYKSHPLRTFVSKFNHRFVIGLLVAGLVVGTWAQFVSADTTPPSGTPATVSADALPTAQINGIVWGTAIKGNTVYAVGKFTQARPAGVPVGGAGSVTRTNIVAFDITTGQIDPNFNHSLSGGNGAACFGSVTGAQGCAVAVSPDGTKLFVGGSFTTVDGQPRNNFAAFNLTNNTLLSGYSGTNNKVRTIAATNSQVYIGGDFSQAGGQTRTRLAAYNTSNGSLNTGWVANVTGPSVGGIVALESKGNLVIGGSFSKINNATYYSSGAVKLSNGANVAWASQNSSYPIRLQAAEPSSTGITGASTDGNQVYFTTFTFLGGDRPGTFEGRFAVNGSNGSIVWLNDCVGDSYASFPIGQVLYSTHHAHSCKPIGGFPEYTPRTYQHATAETTYRTGTNTSAIGGSYPSYVGQPASTLLNWFPDFGTGTASGIYQAGWAMTGNSNYLVVGGEFKTVNGTAQEGLVRFAVKDKAPNKMGPMPYASGLAVMGYPADNAGKALVRTYVTGDPDNGSLTYEVYRVGSSTPRATRTVDSRFWKGTSWTFTDTGLTPGEHADYYLKVKDPFGNSITVNNTTAVNDTDERIVYSGSGWVSKQSRDDHLTDFARGIHYTGANGSSATFSFYGSGITLLSEKNPDRGTASVSIDGGAAQTVNMNSSDTLFQQRVFTKTGLGFGHHTIKVTKTGGRYIDIDAFIVHQDKAVDDNASSGVSYSGSGWVNRQGTAADVNEYGHGIHYTKTNGASVTVTFTGTSVALMDQTSGSHGNIAVSIDGGPAQTVSSYSSSTKLWQIIFQKSGLSSGTHTIKLTKLSGTYMNFDTIFVR